MLREHPAKSDEERADDWLWGHVCAVLAASCIVAVSPLIATTIHNYYFGRGFYPGLKLMELVILVSALFVIFSIFTFFVAMIPVFIVHRIAKRFSIASIWYCVACGALTGTILSSVTFLSFAWVIWDPAPYWDMSLFQEGVMENFMERVIKKSVIVTPMILSGAVGGFAFWWVTGRFIRKKALPTAGV